MAVDPWDEAFTQACLWILERLGGDSRFRSVHPASGVRAPGISFEVSESSRIVISREPGAHAVFLGFATTDRELHERIWKEAGETEEAVAIRLSDRFEWAGLREPVSVARESNGEFWIASRIVVTSCELESPEGRDRMRRRIEGFHLAFTAREKSSDNPKTPDASRLDRSAQSDRGIPDV